MIRYLTQSSRTFTAPVARGVEAFASASISITIKGVLVRSEIGGETELEAVRSAMEYLLPNGAKLGKVKETVKGG